MLNIKSHDNVKKEEVEAQVITAMQEQGYTLNAVNSYGENLLHISAANDCFRIVKEILSQKKNRLVIDRKNKFGWSPLMQAIRNGNIDTVKMLLEKNANIDDATYLGMSVLGLAAAISKEMFETVYNAYPDALANAANDDITPLCVAATKNDKELFFRLLELGMPLSTANNYTRIMMRRSTVPEIVILAEEYLATDDYWKDTSDNIQVISGQSNDDVTGESSKSVLKNDRKRKHISILNLLSIPPKSNKQDLLSPNLTYDTFALSPNVYFTNINLAKRSNIFFPEKDANNGAAKSDLEKYSVTSEYQLKSPPALSQKSLRPLDLGLKKFSNESNTTVEFTPEFSPLKSPHVPPDINEENVYGENTPTPPRCTTPPKGMLLNWQQTKMIMILRRFGFSQYISVFLEQEVIQNKYPKRIFSGIQPTGSVHLGNYFGAIQRWVELQNSGEEVLCSIVDLHSITLPQDPKKLRENTLLMTATLVACGVDFKRSILFQQSKVPMHAELCWILGTITTMARLAHLPQFKEKSEFLKNVPLGLYIYPVLQAADILLYKATHVPVGQDQVQHVQLAQDLAQIFNKKFGQTFPIPHTLIGDGPSQRIKSLREPVKKMSKSHSDPKSRISLLDEPDVLLEKVKKAVTDFTSEVTYESDNRPGVSNLINIHSLFTGKTPEEICKEAVGLNTGQYKLVVADVVIEKITPIRKDILELIKEPSYLDEILKEGAERATEFATDCWVEVTDKVFGSDIMQDAKNMTNTANII
ncbi:uncharacterized protein TrpRS-m isoform X2 [Linepithema humile]|uniref:uncharacterized protein TrpRS-m isoform X2 n=1 Tax=Linepithema humile TaxID=83485 RepID=UPI00351F486E